MEGSLGDGEDLNTGCTERPSRLQEVQSIIIGRLQAVTDLL